MARRAVVLCALAGALLFQACSSTRTGSRGRPADVGFASFYSDRLKGHRTANGEPYDPKDHTCAHRSFPFGARVEVRVLSSGATAVCRVNDRGPYANDRIIDLSRETARKLGIERAGVAEVEIRRID